MPHFRVDDALHSHPKAAIAGDEAMGMWARAGCWSMAYGTDGFIPDWWVRQQLKGAAKAKRLVAAQLWHPGQYQGDRPEYAGQKGYNFHQWRQDSYTKIEADRQKWRDKKAGQRAAESPRMSPGDKPGDTLGDSRESPGYIPITHTQENSGYVESVSPDSTEREPRSAPIRPDANRLVAEIIPKTHPNAVRTELRLQSSALLNEGQPPDIVAAALRLWNTKNVHPKTLPSLISELINRNGKPDPTSTNTTPPGRTPPSQRKVAAALELANRFAENPTRTAALEAR